MKERHTNTDCNDGSVITTQKWNTRSRFSFTINEQCRSTKEKEGFNILEREKQVSKFPAAYANFK